LKRRIRIKLQGGQHHGTYLVDANTTAIHVPLGPGQFSTYRDAGKRHPNGDRIFQCDPAHFSVSHYDTSGLET
jgi:hypothetical protein